MGFAVAKSEPGTEPVSLAEAKAQCEVDHDDRDDWFTLRIPAARQAVEQHTNRVFAACDVTEKFDDFPRVMTAIRLNLPASAIGSVKYYNAAGTEITLTAVTDYLAAVEQVPSLVYPAPGATWPTPQYGRLLGVTVTYTAVVDTRLKMAKAAMLLILGYWWEQRAGESSLISEGVPPAALRIMNGLTRPMYT